MSEQDWDCAGDIEPESVRHDVRESREETVMGVVRALSDWRVGPDRPHGHLWLTTLRRSILSTIV